LATARGCSRSPFETTRGCKAAAEAVRALAAWRAFSPAYTQGSDNRGLGVRAKALKVSGSYKLTAMGKFALLMCMSEFRLRVSSF